MEAAKRKTEWHTVKKERKRWLRRAEDGPRRHTVKNIQQASGLFVWGRAKRPAGGRGFAGCVPLLWGVGCGLMGRGMRWCDAYSVMSSGRIEMVVQLCCFTTTSFMKAWKSAGLRALSVSS